MTDPDLFAEIDQYLHAPLPLEAKSPMRGECQHRRVVLDEPGRIVQCRDCEAHLDPFWYLSLLAREWKHRAYVDRQAVDARRKLDEDTANRKWQGWVYQRPSNGAGREAWDTFAAFLGEAPFAIHRAGRDWYMTDASEVSHTSLSWVRHALARRSADAN